MGQTCTPCVAAYIGMAWAVVVAAVAAVVVAAVVVVVGVVVAAAAGVDDEGSVGVAAGCLLRLNAWQQCPCHSLN